MNTADQWVLCWTQTKNTLHIESLETHLSLNCQSFVKNLSGDYRVLQIGTRAEVTQLSLIHISEPTRPCGTSRMPSSA